ncbi:MAG TPA: glycerophosphodiester phosphodiesterase family protein [Gemmatimonadaceae bacterium]
MRSMPSVWIRSVALIVVVGSTLDCANTATSTPDPVSQLTVEPQLLTLIPDDSAPLTATALSASGGAMSTRVAWSSTDTTVVRVSPSGEVRAIRAGVATITALAGSRTASAVVRASFPPLSGVREYAHRGFGAVYPENTLVAADSALAHGADGIEADVQLTSDGVPVIIHDATVDRTTNGTGSVQALTLTQLRALDACSKKGAQWTPCQVPLAEEMIEKVKGRGLLILDLKGPWSTAQLAKLMAMVRSHGALDQTMVTSFEMSYLTRVRQADPRVMVGWLRGSPTDPAPVLSLGNAAVIVEESAIRNNASTMTGFDSVLVARGSVLGAFTLKGPSQVGVLKSLGVRWWISDIPLDKSLLF